MSSIYGHAFRISTFGESHGGGVGVVIDGCPPGVAVTVEAVQAELDRRRPGQSEIVTPRQEAVKRIEGSLMVEVQKQTNTIDVTFEHKYPVVAQHVLKRLMTYYYAKHVEVFSAQTHPQFIAIDEDAGGAALRVAVRGAEHLGNLD